MRGAGARGGARVLARRSTADLRWRWRRSSIVGSRRRRRRRVSTLVDRGLWVIVVATVGRRRSSAVGRRRRHRRSTSPQSPPSPSSPSVVIKGVLVVVECGPISVVEFVQCTPKAPGQLWEVRVRVDQGRRTHDPKIQEGRPRSLTTFGIPEVCFRRRSMPPAWQGRMARPGAGQAGLGPAGARPPNLAPPFQRLLVAPLFDRLQTLGERPRPDFGRPPRSGLRSIFGHPSRKPVSEVHM